MTKEWNKTGGWRKTWLGGSEKIKVELAKEGKEWSQRQKMVESRQNNVI